MINEHMWHDWFAWRPVKSTDKDKWIWLRTVRRRKTSMYINNSWLYVEKVNEQQ
jgi:hypothetical protein